MALATIVITGAAYLYNKAVQATHDAKAAREEAAAAGRAVEEIQRSAAEAKDHAAAAEQFARSASTSARWSEKLIDKALASTPTMTAEPLRRAHTLLETAANLPEGAAKEAAYQEGAWAKYKENEDLTGLQELREHARRGLAARVQAALFTEWIRLDKLNAGRTPSQTRAFQEIGRILELETPAPPARSGG
jgi:hypothetical protein